jgi:hypothetical protein
MDAAFGVALETGLRPVEVRPPVAAANSTPAIVATEPVICHR